MAAGLTLILGLARVVNFAHGSLFLIGGYLSVMVANATGNWWISLVISAIGLIIIGVAIEMDNPKRIKFLFVLKTT